MLSVKSVAGLLGFAIIPAVFAQHTPIGVLSWYATGDCSTNQKSVVVVKEG